MPLAPAEHANVETHLLLQWLRQTENRDAEWRSDPPWDWRVFADACEFHQVVPLIFRRLDSLPEHTVPAGLSAHLRNRFYTISLANYLLANQLVALTSRLEEEDIPVLALKGPAVAMTVYGDLALRQFQDLDLMVHLEHLPNAIKVMVGAGFRMVPNCRPETRTDRAQLHHATFQAPDQSHFVDLHWQLADDLSRGFSPEVEKVWSHSQTLQLPHGRVSTMCREDLFLVLCYHGGKHRWACLKWLVDVAELLRSADTWNWSRIEEMIANRPGVGASAGLGTLLAHELLGAPVPAVAARILPVTERARRVADAIREEILHSHTVAVDPHRTLLELEERRAARMKYWGTRWFRQVFQVCDKDRAVVQLPEKLEFLYWYIRLLRLVMKHSRRAACSLWFLARSLARE
jgi:hypothetical protein